jgi:hypothetical protein
VEKWKGQEVMTVFNRQSREIIEITALQDAANSRHIFLGGQQLGFILKKGHY